VTALYEDRFITCEPDALVGTANPRFWAHLDPGRPRKPWALVLDVGARVRPVVTPDDADAVLSVLRQRAHGAQIAGAAGGA
jgi:hypothetical protein